MGHTPPREVAPAHRRPAHAGELIAGALSARGRAMILTLDNQAYVHQADKQT
jgi:hypothetical protein